MKIRLKPREILNNTASEKWLSESPLIEAIYEIRKLKAALYYGDQVIEVDDFKHTQVFLDRFDVWVGEFLVENE